MARERTEKDREANPPGAELGCVAVPALSLVAMILGGSIWGGMTSGPFGLLAGPVLALFGWFYLPVVLALQGLAWLAWASVRESGMGRIGFGLCGAVVGAVCFVPIGIVELGREMEYRIAYAVAAGVAAFVSCVTIALVRDRRS